MGRSLAAIQKTRCAFAFHATPRGRSALKFGMGARDNLDELGMLTSPDVAIEIDVEADAAAPAQ